MARQAVRIILKSGNEFAIICEKLTCNYSKLDGELTSIKYEDAIENIPLYLDMTQVAAVLQERVQKEAT